MKLKQDAERVNRHSVQDPPRELKNKESWSVVEPSSRTPRFIDASLDTLTEHDGSLDNVNFNDSVGTHCIIEEPNQEQTSESGAQSFTSVPGSQSCNTEKRNLSLPAGESVEIRNCGDPPGLTSRLNTFKRHFFFSKAAISSEPSAVTAASVTSALKHEVQNSTAGIQEHKVIAVEQELRTYSATDSSFKPPAVSVSTSRAAISNPIMSRDGGHNIDQAPPSVLSTMAPFDKVVAKPCFDSAANSRALRPVPPNSFNGTNPHHGPSEPVQGELNRVASAAYAKAMKDAAHMQMMAAAAAAQSGWGRQQSLHPPPPQSIIIHNTTKAAADSVSDAKLAASNPNGNDSSSITIKVLDILNKFWSSRINRLLVFGLTGALAYFYWEWWQHRRRIELLQRRIEANPLLRLGQIISSTASDRPRNSHGTYY